MTEIGIFIFLIILFAIGLIVGLSFLAWLFRIISKRVKKILIISTLVLVILILIIQTIRTFLYDYPEIVGKSMSPSFTDGKRYLVCRFCNDYKRGDVVIYKSQKDGLEHIGRIVGLPADLIEIYKNFLMINGKKLEENYADWSDWVTNEKVEVKLGKEEYLVLVDKRWSSDDEYETINSQKTNKNGLKGKFLQ